MTGNYPNNDTLFPENSKRIPHIPGLTSWEPTSCCPRVSVTWPVLRVPSEAQLAVRSEVSRDA